MSRTTPTSILRTAEDLLAYLDRLFPEPRTGPKDDLATVMFQAGQREVVLAAKDAVASAARRAEP